MSHSSVPFTGGPPETVLPPAPLDAAEALRDARARPPGERREALSAVVATYPRLLAGWAALAEEAEAAGGIVEGYAYARVGYHRGLDALRGAGWRGSGYVRWQEEPNRGFLASVDALRRAAASIGETDEASRCELFLAQLDPSGRRDVR